MYYTLIIVFIRLVPLLDFGKQTYVYSLSKFHIMFERIWYISLF